MSQLDFRPADVTTATGAPGHDGRVQPSGARIGLVLCLVAGTAFGLAAVLAKESFRSGFTVPSLLTGRFILAAAAFWVIVAVRRPAWPSGPVLRRCVGLGAIGYALQAGCYFGALTQMSAAVAAQLLYLYPALVMLLAVLLRRERFRARGAAALGCSTLGLFLLLSGKSSVVISTPGVLLALGAAVTYALYITVAATLPPELDVYLVSAVVCTAASVSLTGYGAITGSLHPPAVATGWAWLVLFALVPTVIAIVTFLSGLRLVGASVAAILSCLEPVVTAASSALLFGDRLTPLQIVGAATVLAAVGVLQIRRRAGRISEATTVPPA